jgi:hypothetical protein
LNGSQPAEPAADDHHACCHDLYDTADVRRKA